MRTLWLSAVCLVCFLALSVFALAEDFMWKLARIDTDSVTLIGANDSRKIAKIGQNDRAKVAPLLGRSVKAYFEDLKGEQWVVKLESWK